MAVDLVRVGEKLIDKEKIYKTIDRILELRCAGESQQEVGLRLGIDRTFISRLETIGEVRKGRRIALVAFPVGNKEEVMEAARRVGIDYALVLTDKERWDFVRDRSGIELFNEVMQIILKLRQYDTVIFAGSDFRVKLAESILGNRVVSLTLGQTPIKGDRYIDPHKLEQVVQELRA
ncbi:MAG TPA: transcriptional regulator [Firmicutes bacterium]|nr:transcriptional regulator [Bacillota bacterium]